MRKKKRKTKEKSKGNFVRKTGHFLDSSCEKEKREREKKKEKVFRFSLQSKEIGWSDLVGPRVKAHHLAWATHRHQNQGVSTQFQISGLGSVHGTS